MMVYTVLFGKYRLKSDKIESGKGNATYEFFQLIIVAVLQSDCDIAGIKNGQSLNKH